MLIVMLMRDFSSQSRNWGCASYASLLSHYFSQQLSARPLIFRLSLVVEKFFLVIGVIPATMAAPDLSSSAIASALQRRLSNFATTISRIEGIIPIIGIRQIVSQYRRLLSMRFRTAPKPPSSSEYSRVPVGGNPNLCFCEINGNIPSITNLDEPSNNLKILVACLDTYSVDVDENSYTSSSMSISASRYISTSTA